MFNGYKSFLESVFFFYILIVYVCVCVPFYTLCVLLNHLLLESNKRHKTTDPLFLALNPFEDARKFDSLTICFLLFVVYLRFNITRERGENQMLELIKNFRKNAQSAEGKDRSLSLYECVNIQYLHKK